MNYIRTATEAEVITYETVEIAIKDYTDEEFAEFIDKVADFALAWKSADRKAAYNKLRSVARKLGVKVLDLETWYFIESVE